MLTIWSLWQDAIAQERSRPAYLVETPDGWREVSWAEAAEAVVELANGLLALGLGKGDAFGILAHTRLEWSLLDFALAQIGAVAAPIYPSSTPAESCYILEHSNAVGCLVETEADLDKIAAARPEHVYTVETLDELRALGREQAERDPGALDRARAQIGDEDLFTFIYTSGTTGPPKACMILNRNYYEMVGTIHQVEDFFLPTDVMLLYLPLAHNFGRLMHLLGAHLGFTIAFCPDPRRIGEVLPEVRPTILPTVPRVLEKVHTGVSANFAAATGIKRRLIDWALRVGQRVSALRQQGRPVPRGLSAQHRLADRLVYSKVKDRLGGRLRAAISGGAPLAKEIAEFFHAIDILVLEGYGQTEGTTASNVNRPHHFKFGTVGPAIPGIEVTTAEDGEILVRGPTVFAGYYKDAEATSAVLPGDGWLHTGDVGEIDEDGFLTITDRKKDIIVTAGGKNVSPQNVENLLKGIPWVSQALVVGDRRPHLIALITLDEDELAKWATERGLDGSAADLSQRDDVRKLVDEAVEGVNETLARFEQVRRFEILSRDFSAEENEITPTLKLKRRVVEEHFAPEIEKLYAE
ncbi:MAG TPA: long-chain fatty acid--CoA ligase [Gaiellaceae bacterium]|nr:long-chain fatty acid--CoA ligase [Gaiellaceae bacterium]